MKITMDEELLRYNHYNLWNWLAKTGRKKYHAPMIKTLSKIYWNNNFDVRLQTALANECFACGSACDKEGYRDCRLCPIIWHETPNDNVNCTPCYDLVSSFRAWDNSKNKIQRMYYATIIAKLPWRGKKP